MDTKLRDTWEKQQVLLSKLVEIHNNGLTFDPHPPFAGLKLIGGMDLSFIDESNKEGKGAIACATLVVLSYPDFKVIHQDYELFQLTQPYLSGFLAFREAGPLYHLAIHLKQTMPEFFPQVILVDGNGIYHPRGLGLASHLGVLLGVPTIGVAKKILNVDGLTRETVEAQCTKDLKNFGDMFPLCGNQSRILGFAMLGKASKIPMFVSPGHLLLAKTAAELVLACSDMKTPEPIRQADLGSREYLRQWETKHSWKDPKTLASIPLAPIIRHPFLDQSSTVADQDFTAQICPLPFANRYALILERSAEAKAALQEKAEQKRPLYLCFICDCSGSMGNSFKNCLIPACADFYEKFQPQGGMLVMFGKDTTLVDIKHAGFIRAQADKQLEEETNIGKGLSAAVDAVVEHAKAHTDQSPCYVFVFVSDGQDTSREKSFLKPRIESLGALIQDAKLTTLFLVLGVTSEHDTAVGQFAKAQLQTVQAQSHLPPIYYARTREETSVAIAQMAQEQIQIKHSTLLKVEVETKRFLQHVHSARETASASVTLELPPEVDQVTVVVCDEEELKLRINGKPVPTVIHSEVTPMVVAHVVQKSIEQLKVALVIGGSDTKGMRESIDVLKKWIQDSKSSMVKSFHHMTPSARVEMMRTVRTRFAELEQKLNNVSDNILKIQHGSNESKAAFLRSTDDMKFGSKVLRRAEMIETKDILRSLMEIKAEVKESKFDRESMLSVMSESDHLKQIQELQISTELRTKAEQMDVLEFLYAFGMIGLLARIERSAASDISPWMIKVAYLSADVADSSSVMCALDGEYKLKDLSDQPVEDIILVVNPLEMDREIDPVLLFRRTELHKVLLSVTFTRNPTLCMPEQGIALLLAALTTGIRQLTLKKTRTQAHIQNVLAILATVRKCYDRWICPDGRLGIIVKKLRECEDPSTCLTEAEEDNIQSLVLVLGALCLDDGKEPWTAKVLSAILAEGLSRQARSYLKKPVADGKDNNKPMTLAGLLNILPDSCPPVRPDDEPEPKTEELKFSTEYDGDRAFKFACRFLTPAKVYRGNLDLKALLAVFRFLKVKDRSVLEIQAAFHKKLTWLGFLREQNIVPVTVKAARRESKKPLLVASRVKGEGHELYTTITIALVAQAFRWNSSKERRQGIPSFATQSTDLLQRLSYEARENIYREQVGAKIKRLRMAEMKLRKEIRESQKGVLRGPFLAQHADLPILFTSDEVKKLNLERGLLDQLELDPHSYLLRHHCTYPKCAHYLKNFATEKDIDTNSRQGLFHHLSPMMEGDNKTYFKGLHRDSVAYLESHPKATVEDFIHFHVNLRPVPRAVLMELYDQYKKILRI